MKKIVLCLLCLGLLQEVSISLANSEIIPLKITNNVGAYMEIPPTVISTGAKQLNLSTGFSYTCVTRGNILIDNIALTNSDCFKTLTADIYGLTPAMMPINLDWRRNYNGIFSQHLIQMPEGNRLININHGENKNEVRDGLYYQNTLSSKVDVRDCAS